MLTREEIQALIAFRVMRATASCNSHHLTLLRGQIEGLLAVLNGGERFWSDNITDLLDRAGIPCQRFERGEFEIPLDWLRARGFDEDGEMHPNFTHW